MQELDFFFFLLTPPSPPPPFKSRSHYVFHSLAFSCDLHLQPSPRACACCGLLQISPSRLHQLRSGPVSAYLQLAAGQCGHHCGSQCSMQYIRTSVCVYIYTLRQMSVVVTVVVCVVHSMSGPVSVCVYTHTHTP